METWSGEEAAKDGLTGPEAGGARGRPGARGGRTRRALLPALASAGAGEALRQLPHSPCVDQGASRPVTSFLFVSKPLYLCLVGC